MNDSGGHVWRSAAGKNNYAGKCKFEFIDEYPLLEDEKFKKHPVHNIELSQYGKLRIILHRKKCGYIKYGKIWKGYKHKKYRRIELKKKGFLVHRLVYETFSDVLIEPNILILHNDSLPDKVRYDQDGCERNYLCDLRVGTCQENSSEYWTQKMGNKRIQATHKQSGHIIIEKYAQLFVKKHGFNSGKISSVLNGKRKSHKGYKFEYIN